jgi:alanine dehydrogenase
LGIVFIDEEECRRSVLPAEAFAAVEKTFVSMSRGQARNFPVVRESIGHANALYGFKSGFDRSSLTLGVKAGGYWPENTKKALTNHQSSVFLFDADSGQLQSIVSGNFLTAVRTAAASAVSIKHLARADSRVLGIIGAGHQAGFQLRAACQALPFAKVLAWNLHTEMLPSLEKSAHSIRVPFSAVDRETLCAEADVIITITSSFEPLLKAQWIRPGTHLACMGSDTVGKQEIDVEIAMNARRFCDDVSQSLTIGEFQHAAKAGRLTDRDVIPIGDVICGSAQGRTGPRDITVFDGTGVALQDLAVAAIAVEKALKNGRAKRIAT